LHRGINLADDLAAAHHESVVILYIPNKIFSDDGLSAADHRSIDRPAQCARLTLLMMMMMVMAHQALHGVASKLSKKKKTCKRIISRRTHPPTISHSLEDQIMSTSATAAIKSTCNKKRTSSCSCC
jgi:hypothetical protein